jgi:hypothetical protein
MFMQFMPLVGGTFIGPVSWSQAQQFPAAQVILPGNPSYPHQNTWRTVWDHINDPSIHLQKSLPLPHATSHLIGGTDVLNGDFLQISATLPGQSIKTYIDTRVNAASAAATTNFAPSARYEISGADPLYGNLIPISSSSPSTDIKTYVDSSIAALSGSYPSTATFTTVTNTTALQIGTSSVIKFWNGSAYVAGISSDNTNLAVRTPLNTGQINLGNQSAANAYGSVSASGYAIGSSIFGPTSGNMNGPFSIAGDVSVNRAQSGASTKGLINMGASADGAYFSYNVDAANLFYFSKGATINGSINVVGGTVSLGSYLNASSGGLLLSGIPLQITNGTGLAILGSDANGSLELRTTLSSGTPFIDFTQGSTGATTPNYTSRLALTADGLRLATTSGFGALFVSINGGYTAGSGDIGVARSSVQGAVFFGSSVGGGSLDYGVNASGVFSFGVNSTVISQIKADGSYSIGSSLYGATSATVNGTITSQKAIYAKTGIAFSGASGFSFTDSGASFDTGMFSNGTGDLRFYTGSSNLALRFSSLNATFGGDILSTGLISAANISTTAAITVGSNLTLTGNLSAGGTTISKFRVKNMVELGWNPSTSNTGYAYPNKVMLAYSTGTIDAIRLSALTTDASTQTTFNITKNGAVIGTIALPNGQKTAKALPTIANTPIAEGDQLQAVCTTAGTSTGVTVTLEVSQFVQ